jgi:hypothetical protein
MKSPKVAVAFMLAFAFVNVGIQPIAVKSEKVVEQKEISAIEKLRGAKKLNAHQLSAILAHVGFRGNSHKIAWAVMMRESRGNPRAHNRNESTADDSYGLFQINMRGYLGKARRVSYGLSRDSQLLDPLTNAWVAFRMSKGGRDFGPWGIGPNAYRKNRGIETVSRHFESYPGYPKAKKVNSGKKTK